MRKDETKAACLCYPESMKIDGTKSTSDIQKKEKSKKSSGSDGDFGALLKSGEGESSASTQSTSMSRNIASIDALLAAQATEDPAQKKARKYMKQRAESILDRLSDLKVAMITGSITVGHMISIADVVASHREKIIDPELSAILDEIDLRAQVELAKLQMAKNRI